MANSSKSKGKRVEQEVCNLLSSVFNLSFRRVPNSGAYIGGNNVARMAQMSETQILLSRGDIIPPTEMSGAIFECKGRQAMPFHTLVKETGSPELNSWISQVEIDWAAAPAGFYCIIIKLNNLGFFICYNSDFVGPEKITPIKNHIVYSYNNKTYIIHELRKEFLKTHEKWLLTACAATPK